MSMTLFRKIVESDILKVVGELTHDMELFRIYPDVHGTELVFTYKRADQNSRMKTHGTHITLDTVGMYFPAYWGKTMKAMLDYDQEILQEIIDRAKVMEL